MNSQFKTCETIPFLFVGCFEFKTVLLWRSKFIINKLSDCRMRPWISMEVSIEKEYRYTGELEMKGAPLCSCDVQNEMPCTPCPKFAKSSTGLCGNTRTLSGVAVECCPPLCVQQDSAHCRSLLVTTRTPPTPACSIRFGWVPRTNSVHWWKPQSLSRTCWIISN